MGHLRAPEREVCDPLAQVALPFIDWLQLRRVLGGLAADEPHQPFQRFRVLKQVGSGLFSPLTQVLTIERQVGARFGDVTVLLSQVE